MMIINFPKPKRQFRPQRESVVNRGQACALAASQPGRAFDLARTIPDGWYRSQAMAHIAKIAPPELSEQAFREARAAAAQSFDNYQRVGVLPSVITAAFARGHNGLVNDVLGDAFALIPSIEPIASRAYALNLLWSTIAYHGDGKLRRLVIAEAQAHVHPDRSWRARRLYREITDWLAERDPRKAKAVICAMPEGKSRTYLERRIGEIR
jgi:hypothetical protein